MKTEDKQTVKITDSTTNYLYCEHAKELAKAFGTESCEDTYKKYISLKCFF